MTNEKMKVCIVQPPYSANYSDSDTFFAWEMEAFEKCDESMDLIVFPESTDVPAFAENNELHRQSYRKYNEAILKKASEKSLERSLFCPRPSLGCTCRAARSSHISLIHRPSLPSSEIQIPHGTSRWSS